MGKSTEQQVVARGPARTKDEQRDKCVAYKKKTRGRVQAWELFPQLGLAAVSDV